MDEQRITTELAHFTGSETFTRYSVLARNNVVTEGVKYLADSVGCYWLLDVIDSWAMTHKTEGFIVTKLVMNHESCDIALEDGNGTVLYRQHVSWTDFPLPEITLFSAKNDLGGWTHMLPSEY